MDPRRSDVEEYQIYYRTSYKDHILEHGDTLCSYNVRVPHGGESDNCKPLSEVTEREWRYMMASNSFCSGCRASASRANLIPEVPDGLPAFYCPKCGESVKRVLDHSGIGIAEHQNGESHTFEFRIFERWRRGEDPEELDLSSAP